MSFWAQARNAILRTLRGETEECNNNLDQRSITESEESTTLRHDPDHVLVLVHGINGSQSDWMYTEAELKKKLGNNFLIYVSSSNTYKKTFDGVDKAGTRLADEIRQVVKNVESLKKISILAHSLGGLFARYAIGLLHSSTSFMGVEPDDLAGSEGFKKMSKSPANLDTVAGLEPINFITLATPHLGVRGNKQLPFLFGLRFLEKLAPPLAPLLVGRTGPQLFLTDGEAGKPPLLLRMAFDCEDLKFISALAAFRYRALYSNISYDHMVGRRTSSIRRETELITPSLCSLEGYNHIVEVEDHPPKSPQSALLKEATIKERAIHFVRNEHPEIFDDEIEERMVCGLQSVGWKKVDVSFHSAPWPFFAHNNINVKSELLNNAGFSVIAHIADSLKKQESDASLCSTG